jgi:hypothetical protein
MYKQTRCYLYSYIISNYLDIISTLILMWIMFCEIHLLSCASYFGVHSNRTFLWVLRFIKCLFLQKQWNVNIVMQIILQHWTLDSLDVKFIDWRIYENNESLCPTNNDFSVWCLAYVSRICSHFVIYFTGLV